MALSCLLAAPRWAWAQTGSHPGYVVTIGGDTLRGTVVIASAQVNASTCVFRAGTATAERSYSPSELSAFATAEVEYETGQVALAPTLAAIPQFLEVLARGPLTLLALSQKNTVRYFLRPATGSVLTELVKTTQQVQMRGQTYAYVGTAYRDTLAHVLRACPAIAKRAAYVGFHDKELAKLVQAYNACVAPLAAPRNIYLNRGTFSVGLLAAGSVYNQIKFGKGDGTSLLNAGYRGHTFSTLGIAVRYTPGFRNGAFTMHTGVQYEANRRYDDSHTNIIIGSTITPVVVQPRIQLAFDFLVFPLALRYSFGRGALHPYLETGISARFLLKTRQDELITTYSVAAVPTSVPFLGENKSIFNAGGLAGVGLGVGNRFSAGIRGELASTPSTYLGSSSQRSVSVLLSYFLTH